MWTSALISFLHLLGVGLGQFPTAYAEARVPGRGFLPAPGTVSAIGVYAERIQVHMGIVWIKALTLKTGHANVIGHVDRVLAMLSGGVLDPGPLVTHHMKLEDAAEAYAVYDRREALKIVMKP